MPHTFIEILGLKNFSLAAILLAGVQQDALTADIRFDKTSKTANILAVTSINPTYQECTNIKYSGAVTTVTGNYPNIVVWLRTTQRVKEAFELDLHDFDMVTLKSFHTLIGIGKHIRVEGQICGSGGFFYPVNIRAGKK